MANKEIFNLPDIFSQNFPNALPLIACRFGMLWCVKTVSVNTCIYAAHELEIMSCLSRAVWFVFVHTLHRKEQQYSRIYQSEDEW